MDYKGILLGVKASIIASACCSLPLALAAAFSLAGAGSITAALKIPKYKIFFMAAGTVFLAASLYLTIKRRCGGACTIGDLKKQKTMIAASAITYVALTLLIIYVILPIISELVFALV